MSKERLTTNDKELIGTEDCLCEDIRRTHVYSCGNCIIQQTINKLAEYEDLEEQGLILRLPCKVGDAVYILGESTVFKAKCVGFEMRNNDWRVACSITDYSFSPSYERFDSVFLTQSEAEEKLRELEGK